MASDVRVAMLIDERGGGGGGGGVAAGEGLNTVVVWK